jgi:hypothetical protein
MVCILFLVGTACSDQTPVQKQTQVQKQTPSHKDADAHFKNITDQQNLERKNGQSCTAKSKIKQYKKELFSKEQHLLAFEFPDGVMGGAGKIPGKREVDSLDDWQCGALEFEQCTGAQLYRENGYDHMSFIVIPSSEKDQKIISCALDHLAGSFNIGLSSNDPTELGRMNEKPFAHLHNLQASNDAQTH